MKGSQGKSAQRIQIVQFRRMSEETRIGFSPTSHLEHPSDFTMLEHTRSNSKSFICYIFFVTNFTSCIAVLRPKHLLSSYVIQRLSLRSSSGRAILTMLCKLPIFESFLADKQHACVSDSDTHNLNGVAYSSCQLAITYW